LTVLLFAAFTVAGPVVIVQRRADAGGSGGDGGGKVRGGADAPLVTMRNLKFDPATLTIKRGTEVTFANKDVAPHTVTTDDADSGIIAPGGSYKLVVTEPVDYVCTIHPSMKARIELSG
jgi:plastocyanin